MSNAQHDNSLQLVRRLKNVPNHTLNEGRAYGHDYQITTWGIADELSSVGRKLAEVGDAISIQFAAVDSG